MKKKFSVLLTMIFCALVAQAQDTPPDAAWESDPLDVLEPQAPQQTVEPSVPEFKEIPEPGQESLDAPPPATVDVPPAATDTAPTAFGGNEPDYSREAEFHRIYKTYNEQPTPVEAWEKAVGARESETYQVQKGDTLSGISTTFFGDPLFWPKIWSLNKGQILNPHEIDPGMSVQFFPGSMDDAPTLDVGETALINQKAEKDKDETAASTAGASIPRGRKRVPLLKTLPNSLPMYRMGTLAETKVQLQVELPKTKFPTAMEYLEYYIQDTPAYGAGVVTAAELEMKTAGEYQYVFVQLDNGSAGQEYVAQKNVGTVPDPAQKGRSGFMVEVQGEIQILERVNSQKNIYRAMVKKSLQPVQVGAVLTPGKLPMIDPSAGPISGGVGAKIMGGHFEAKRKLFGSNSLVFLDAGTNQGLQEGQVLAIHADERIRNKKNEAVMNDRVIGAAKIVKVSGNFATAYITRATEDILLGDYVGSATVHATNMTPSSAPSQATPAIEQDFEKDFEEAPAAPSGSSPESGSEDLDLEL
ncbi:MAG: signal peptide protein [Bdellovibrio sp. ArHS]|uniref:LysM peptidoglycan-binding domain-containing protein n=1 Tax=Bdellovibrio sp. ArHS TaxID=1569284 RepID=UPI0005825E8C|nr:LysM peptidoglycan-binding domain-containing protein [Bdellovibrio sp. ArHS]KHD87676.1 MAG: signal peptide protein [Bdellovibrio sp. ArHS]